ncbi:hypothetical protein AVEN_241747-1 [Araneus ventricosus]|uniref:Uncharacterized protein n=1 Tax=Araneus ventricosus TaxID=182803 RepID=A0A4Y2GT19_ARAVE|nr:hypothetical protein AVEN_241747-1 [Araneus ventricosus]
MSCVMGDPKTVLEGSVKYRDKKKWKSRWAVVSKLSPVAALIVSQITDLKNDRCPIMYDHLEHRNVVLPI